MNDPIWYAKRKANSDRACVTQQKKSSLKFLVENHHIVTPLLSPNKKASYLFKKFSPLESEIVTESREPTGIYPSNKNEDLSFDSAADEESGRSVDEGCHFLT